MTNKLSEFVVVERQFLRSVRLDADIGRADAMQGYILQQSAQNVLEVTSTHVLNSQQRAFTWTGPYGGGKSSLALALASLAGGDDKVRKAARNALGITNASPIYKTFATRTRWTVLPVVGKRASVIDEIGASIDKYLPGGRGRKPQLDGRRDVIAELVKAAETRPEIGGVLLIIDELGKFLEHASHTGDDVGFYQDLAEAASRSKGNIVIIGILHQSFEQYASRLGHSVQQEWAKIQGRYVDIPLVAGSDEVVALIGRALRVDFPHRTSSSKVAAKVAKVIRKRRPSAATDVGELLDACWPLHPVTAALLGPASRKRFGQNERSVFSFLASAEPLGFTEVVGGLEANASSYYWPHQFWDYLRVNFEPAILASSDSHRWAVCAEAIERAEARFSKLHVELVKTVGLIEILRNGSGLAAEIELLKASVNSSSAKLIDDALIELVSASILIFRKHLDAFGVYAGSDFDIEAAIRHAKTQVSVVDLAKMADLVDLAPVTARRHYWTTGAMRWFSRNLVHEAHASTYVSKFSTNGSQCGEFVLIVGDSSERKIDIETRSRNARKLSELAKGRGLVVGTPQNSARLEELIGELSALEFVRKNNQQLEGDDVAMREIAARTQSTRSMLSDELRDGFHGAAWHSADRVSTRKHTRNAGLSHLASEIADAIYSESPTVHSELINRDAISSNAAKAQRELMHSMLTRSSEPNLGYVSFSADAGLYHTVVRSLGLHREEDGVWKIYAPMGTTRSESMDKAWAAAERLLFESVATVSLDELYSTWRRPPLGIKAGLLPIFALAFFMANRNRLALYLEGMFTPEVTEAHIDEWLQDPRRIGWRYVRIEATERRMLEALSTALTERMGFAVSPDALDSARALVAMVYQLSPWARRTMQISKDAQSVRQLLLAASDPHKVLFADLPLVLDTRSPEQLAARVASITGELIEVFPLRLREVELKLLSALDHVGDLNLLNARAAAVAGIGTDFKLDAFSARLTQYSAALQDIEGLLMLAVGKATKDWNDHDLNAGEMQLISWAMEFRRLETLAQVRGRPANRRAIGVVFGSSRTVTGTFDVSESDNTAIQLLAAELLTKMADGKLKREVFLAAIAEVGATLFEESNFDQERGHG